MTLIVGILCSDGVVLGADGAATYGAMGDHTIRQPTKKISLISDCGALGCSGPVGLGQRIHGEVATLWEQRGVKGEAYQAMQALRDAIWRPALGEWKVAEATRPVIGPNLSSLSAAVQTLIALPVKREMCLFSFDHQGSPEQATPDLPFVAIGSGQRIADPFLAFLRRIFWSNRLPTLGEGEFAALWCLRHAIDTNPGGVADPIQIVILERPTAGGAPCVARELTDGEVQEHEEAIKFAENRLAGFREKMDPAVGDPPPDIPEK